MKNLFIVTGFGLVLAFNTQAATPSQANYDPAYAGNVTALFDQSDMLERADFLLADETQKQKMLVTEFESRKSDQYFEVLKSYVTFSLPVLAPLTIYKVYQIAAGRNQPGAPVPAGVAHAPVAGLGVAGVGAILIAASNLLQPVSYIIINPIAHELERFSAALTKYASAQFRAFTVFFRDDLSRNRFVDELEKFEYSWVTAKRNVTTSLWGPIESAIAKARTAQGASSGPIRKTIDVPALIQAAIALPNNVKTLTFDPAKITEEFRGYELDSPDALYEFCFRFVSASRLNSPISKIPLYFQGPAGVGKTEAARKLARVLDASIGEVSLGKVTHINDLFGWKRDHEKAGPGLIVEAMIRANKDGRGSKNLLLVFDESDAVLNQFKTIASELKTVLEPKTTSFYNEYFEANIDISHIGFIFIGNTKLADPALANRMQPVGFKGFVAGFKSELILGTFVPQLLINEFSHQDLGVIELNEGDKAFIAEMVETDSDPGFRSIHLNVRRYLEHKALAKQFGRPMGPFKPVKYIE